MYQRHESLGHSHVMIKNRTSLYWWSRSTENVFANLLECRPIPQTWHHVCWTFLDFADGMVIVLTGSSGMVLGFRPETDEICPLGCCPEKNAFTNIERFLNWCQKHTRTTEIGHPWSSQFASSLRNACQAFGASWDDMQSPSDLRAP